MYGVIFFHSENAVAVNREIELIVVGDGRFDVKIGIACKNDRTVAERMRADRRENNALDARVHNGTSRGEGIGGGTCRRGDDQTVRAVFEAGVAVVHDLEVDDVTHRAA